jgi:hypothetical protein
MKTYTVKQYKNATVELTYIVEANSEDEALMRISDGDVDPVDFNLIVNEQIDEITVEETLKN